MKIKALSRPAASQQPQGSVITKQSKNLDPEIHPFAKAREYTRAVNAVKLERLFAAPFVAQIGEGHVDSVTTLATDPNSLQRVASASADGVVKVWDLTSREEVWSTSAHANIVKSVCWTRDQKLLSCGTDRSIKLFSPYDNVQAPISTWLGTGPFASLSHHRSKNAFAAASNVISIYDLERHTAAPEILRWPNSTDTITNVAFNQVETSVLASAATDRSVLIWDLRAGTPVSKTVLNFASNQVAWNPQEAFNFAVANEDHNIYIFDSRKMDRALQIFKDHVAAVMSVQWSPTGEELVSGSYDRTIRIWRRDQGHSRDVYHTKRMQRVFSVTFTADSKFLISGSDDGNLRLWRSEASRREGIQSSRQRQAREYNDKLVDKYAHVPEVRRIRRHRHLPTVVKKAGEIKREELAALKRRAENLRKHSKLQFEKRKAEREGVVLAREK